MELYIDKFDILNEEQEEKILSHFIICQISNLISLLANMYICNIKRETNKIGNYDSNKIEN